MQPVLKDGVTLGTFLYEDSDIVHYFAENAKGEEFELSSEVWNALCNADGIHPLDLPDNGKSVLKELKENGLISTSRIVHNRGLFNYFILFPINDRKQNGNLSCKIVSIVLLALSIPVFTIGAYLMISDRIIIGFDFNWWLYIAGIIGAVTLHELGHLITGLAYGFRVRNTGILLFGFIPTGAYVAFHDDYTASKAEKVQLYLAGVAANLLIAGSCFIAAAFYYPGSFTLVVLAYLNAALAAVNLLPTAELDGEAALSSACELENISETAEKWLLSKKRRKKLLHSGLSGRVAFGVFAVTLISRVIFWAFVVMDIVCVIIYIIK